ncbi:MAG: hypothetical protein WA790_21175 [Sulfitobacter sp.]
MREIKTLGNEIDTQHLGMVGGNFLRRKWHVDAGAFSVSKLSAAFRFAFEKWSMGKLSIQGRTLWTQETIRPLQVLELDRDAFEIAFETTEATLGTDTMIVLVCPIDHAGFDVAFLCSHMVMDAAGLRFFLRDVAAFLMDRAKLSEPHANPVERWANLINTKMVTPQNAEAEEKIAALDRALQDTSDQNAHPAFAPAFMQGSDDIGASENHHMRSFATTAKIDAFTLEAICYNALADTCNVKRFNYLTYDACRRPLAGEKAHVFAAAGIYISVPILGADNALPVTEIANQRREYHQENSDYLVTLVARNVLGADDAISRPPALPYVIFNLRGRPIRTLATLDVIPASPSWCSYTCALNLSIWQDNGEVQIGMTCGAGTDPALPEQFFSRVQKVLE